MSADSTSRPIFLGALLVAFVALSALVFVPAAWSPPFLQEGAALARLAGGTSAEALAFQEHPDESRPLANLVRHYLPQLTGSQAALRIAAAILNGLTAWIILMLCRVVIRREGRWDAASFLAPAAATVIFLACPLTSEAIMAHSALPLVLATTLALLSLLLAALEGASTAPPRPFGPAAIFLVALLSDVTVWPLALVAAALARRPREDGSGRGGFLRALWPYGLSLALYYAAWVVRLWPSVRFLEIARVWGFLRGVASQSAVFVTELRLLFAPWTLSVDHGGVAYIGRWGAQALLGAVLLALVLVAGARFGRGATLTGIGVGGFAALHLHFVLFPPLEPLSERRLYAVVAVLSFLTAAVVLRLERRAGSRIAFAAAALVAAPLAFLTVDRVRLWEDPFALWEAAAKANPRSPVPHVTLGALHLDRGETDRAMQSFEAALSIAPGSPAVEQQLAEAYASKGDYQRAAAEAGKALALDPDYFPAFITAGTAFMMRNLPRDAFIMFNEALRRRPNDATALYHMGALLYDQNRFGKAAELLQLADQARPRDPDILFRLGMSRLNINDLTGAAEALHACLAESSDRIDARVNLSSILTQLGHHEEARQQIDQVLDADPGNSKALNNKAVLLSAEERWAEARELFERSAASDPNDQRTLYNLAGAYEHLGETEKAIRAYRDFLSRWTGSLEVGEEARARLAALEAGASR